MGAVSEELGRLFSFEERHRRLLARLTLVVAATGVIDACGTATIYFLERHAHGTEVQSVGQAFFFTTVQLLTVSSHRIRSLLPAERLTSRLSCGRSSLSQERRRRSRPSSKTLTRSNLSLAGLAARSTSCGGAVPCGGGTPMFTGVRKCRSTRRGWARRGLAWGEGNCGTPPSVFHLCAWPPGS